MSKSVPVSPISSPSQNVLQTSISSHQFSPHPLLNAEISHLISLLIRDFVLSWYAGISTRSGTLDFTLILVPELARISRDIGERLEMIDWVSALCQDLPDLLNRHVTDYKSCALKVGTTHSAGYSLSQLFLLCQPHFALTSESDELEYFQGVSAALLRQFLDKKELDTELLTSALTECLTTVLINLVNSLSRPETVHQILHHIFIRGDPKFEALHTTMNTTPTREEEVLNGLKRAQKNTASLLDSLLRSDSPTSPNSSLKNRSEAASPRSSVVDRLAIDDNRRQVVGDAGHPLSTTYISTPIIDRPLLLPLAAESLSSSLSGSGLRHRPSMSLDALFQDKSAFSRPRSNATLITKKQLSNMKTSALSIETTTAPPIEKKAADKWWSGVWVPPLVVVDLFWSFYMAIGFLLTSTVIPYLSSLFVSVKLNVTSVAGSPSQQPPIKNLEENWLQLFKTILHHLDPNDDDDDDGSRKNSLFLTFLEYVYLPFARFLFNAQLQSALHASILAQLSESHVAMYIAHLRGILWDESDIYIFGNPSLLAHNADNLSTVKDAIYAKVPDMAMTLLEAGRVRGCVDELVDLLTLYPVLNKRLILAVLDLLLDKILK